MHATQLTPTVVEPTPGDTLRRAADYLEAHGWVQGSYYGALDVPNPPACSIGALAIAAYGYRHPEPFSDVFTDDDGQTACWLEFVNAEFTLATYIGRHHIEAGSDDLDSVHTWNDTEGQTAAEVIATLRAAADDCLHPGGAA